MVVSPESVLAAEVIGATGGPGEVSGAVLWCDGRRAVDLPPGARVEVRRGAQPVLLARLRGDATVGTEPGEVAAPDAGVNTGASFTDRLVVKFGLPVAGWRGRTGPRPEPSVPAQHRHEDHGRDQDERALGEELAGDA
jgi:NAD+ kinase